MHAVSHFASFDVQPCLNNSMFNRAREETPGVIARLIADNALDMVMQPIVDLASGTIYAHEALVRGPKGGPFHSPDILLKSARSENLLFEFEIACVVKALQNWSTQGLGGRIFINASASALASLFRGMEVSAITSFIERFGISPRSVVFEITEYEHVSDVPDFIAIASDLHSAGLRFALDDFGDGRSSLRLWAELAPDVVKIDKYFTKDISNNAIKIKTIRALMQMADNFECSLVAEGIETAQDLRVLRDMGMQLGQGYFLGMPQDKPLQAVDERSRKILAGTRVSVMPTQAIATQKISLHESMIIRAPSVTRQTSNSDVLQIFLDNPNYHAVAVVDGTCPVAIIGRAALLSYSAKPYFGELFGKKSCMRHANLEPRTMELDQNVHDLIGILTSQDQRYLSEGLIYTDNGQYVGIGLGEHLVRLVTESRVEAARHANPLTFLPGNIPITEHINRLLERNGDFVVAYADLANFKPFNDHYGYWQGDEVIKLVAATMTKNLDRTLDFIGHVGGDDFLLVFQSDDWQARLSQGISEFNLAAVKLHDRPAIEAGGIEAEDRHGVKRFFPMTTLYAGVVHAHDGPFNNASEVSSAAAKARHQAKKDGVDIYVNQTPMSSWALASV